MTDAEIIELVNSQVAAQVAAAVQKVRVPELPDYTLGGDTPSLSDRLPIWKSSDNKTVQLTLEILKAFLINSSDEVISPKLMGNKLYVTAGLSENDTNVFNISAIAGKEFALRRAGGAILEPEVDYEILSSGGFKLLPDDNKIYFGEKFELELVSTDGVTLPAPGSGRAATIFDGAVPLPVSTSLNVTNHLNKLLQLRPSAAGMETTLYNIEDLPDNSLVVIEATLATRESKVKTQAGQNIYFRGTSSTYMYLRKGDYLVMYRGSDGYYVLWASPRLYTIGAISFGMKVESDELELIGQDITDDVYPGAIDWIKTLGDSVVDKDTWETPSVVHDGVTILNPYRGCFAMIDEHTYRLPDYRNCGIRVLGGPDSERFFNKPGGFQKGANEAHNHVEAPYNKASAKASDTNPNASPSGVDGNDPSFEYKVGSMSSGDWTLATIKDQGRIDARMDNIGLKAKIKI